MPITKKRVLKQISLNAGEQFARVNVAIRYTDSVDGSVEEKGIDLQANSGPVRAAAQAFRNAVLTELSAEMAV